MYPSQKQIALAAAIKAHCDARRNHPRDANLLLATARAEDAARAVLHEGEEA